MLRKEEIDLLRASNGVGWLDGVERKFRGGQKGGSLS